MPYLGSCWLSNPVTFRQSYRPSEGLFVGRLDASGLTDKRSRRGELTRYRQKMLSNVIRPIG